MTKEYKVDLRDLDDKKKEVDDSLFFDMLFEMIKKSEPIDFSEYKTDESRHKLFNSVANIVSMSVDTKRCAVSTTIGQGGFVGTISIKCKHLIPKDHTLLKSAILASDSLEMEADLEGNVVINLTFFDMLKRVSDRSKN